MAELKECYWADWWEERVVELLAEKMAKSLALTTVENLACWKVAYLDASWADSKAGWMAEMWENLRVHIKWISAQHYFD